MLVQVAVVLDFAAELVEGGNVLPVIVGRGYDLLQRSLVEEVLQVPLGELFGVLRRVRLHHAALLLNVCLPELELQVADGGGALSQTGHQQVRQHDGGD